MKVDLKKIPFMWIGGFNESRANRMRGMIARLGLMGAFVQAVKHENMNGNTKSTMNALQLALGLRGPVVVLEDDATETSHYCDEIDIPDDADAVWLGTSVYGLVDDWRKLRLSDEIYVNKPTILSEHGNFFRVENMLSAHAVMYISKRYKSEMVNYMKYQINDFTAPDIVFAATMKNYNIYAAKRPLFWQNDGAHNSQPTLQALEDINT